MLAYYHGMEGVHFQLFIGGVLKAWLSPDSLAQIHGGNQNSTAYSVSWKLIPFAVERTSEQNRVNKAK